MASIYKEEVVVDQPAIWRKKKKKKKRNKEGSAVRLFAYELLDFSHYNNLSNLIERSHELDGVDNVPQHETKAKCAHTVIFTE